MSDSLGNLFVAAACFLLTILSMSQHQRIKALEAAMEQIAAYEDITSSGRAQRPVSGGP